MVVHKVVRASFSDGNEFDVYLSPVPVELGQPWQQSVENGEERYVGDIPFAQVVPGVDKISREQYAVDNVVPDFFRRRRLC